ncbi:hypothetical protein [Polaribacter sp. Asnod6-C07]|uniref:hypothetical protein n=1 Tax=Polaribacter sp. Asnod6-C07 TaxID=3160582 RepID=UPI00386D2955
MANNKPSKLIKLTPSIKPNSSPVKSNRTVTSINTYRTDKMINNLASLLKK